MYHMVLPSMSVKSTSPAEPRSVSTATTVATVWSVGTSSDTKKLYASCSSMWRNIHSGYPSPYGILLTVDSQCFYICYSYNFSTITAEILQKTYFINNFVEGWATSWNNNKLRIGTHYSCKGCLWAEVAPLFD